MLISMYAKNSLAKIQHSLHIKKKKYYTKKGCKTM